MAGVHIYRPSKTATQSGLARTRSWLLEFETGSGKTIEPLMGWTSSTDTMRQVTLSFGTRERAIAFAEANNLTYRVSSPEEKRTKRKSYSDNFRYRENG